MIRPTDDDGPCDEKTFIRVNFDLTPSFVSIVGKNDCFTPLPVWIGKQTSSSLTNCTSYQIRKQFETLF